MIIHPVTPPVQTDTLTCGITTGLTTVTSSAAFGSVAVGQRLFGVGIPFGATVTAKASTSSITISEPATATNASASIQFAYLDATPTAYTAGDVMGFPFAVPMQDIHNIMVIDAAKQITAVKLYLFSGIPAVTLDNAAFAPSDADAKKIVAYLSLTGTVALTNNHIIFPAVNENLFPRIGGQKLYGQLVAVGTPTFAAVDDLVINFSGE